MERLHGALGLGVEGDVGAVAGASGIAVARKLHPKAVARVAIGHGVGQKIRHALETERAQNRVIKFCGAFHIRNAERNMMEHRSRLLL